MSWLKKNKLLLLLIIVFLFLNNLPYLAGSYQSIINKNISYNGSPLVNEGDYFVYLSYIEQGKENIFTRNLYDYQAGKAVLFSPLWFVVGQVARLNNNIISYHIFRLIFTLGFITVLWWWLKKIFATYKKQLLALTTVLFGNGLGVFFLSFWPNRGISPVNLWVSEANTFLNLYQGPLFSLSQTLIILIFALFIKSVRDNTKKLIPLYFFLSLLLFILHPYELVIINLVLSSWAISEYQQNKNKKIVLYLAYLYLASVLAALYYLKLFQDPSMGQYREQNIVASGNILEYLFGFGGLFILSFWGIYYAGKNKLLKNPYLRLILIWVILGWIMVYLPLNFNRRLANGWHIPLAIMSALALTYIYQRAKPLFKGSLIALVAIVLSFDTFYHILLYTDNIYNNSRDSQVYLSPDRLSIYKIINLTIPKDSTILTRALEGNRLPAFVNAKVYVGHDIQTWQAEEKNKETFSIWTSQEDISQWLDDHQINYIFASREYIKEIDNIKWLAQEPYIKSIINDKDFIFYEVRR
ncbi:hypothetical protein C4566_02135 [Candidatus Parcubacteria bacterium]|nr:MAG: hypothetical protein C4566_02135 [Candidatus Parcubacteria bacterium]